MLHINTTLCMQVYSIVLMSLVFAAYCAIFISNVVPGYTWSPSLLLNVSVALTALVALTGISLLSKLTGGDDRLYATVISSLGFIACVAYFGMEPQGILSWSPITCAEAAVSLLKYLLEQALMKSELPKDTLRLDTMQPPASLIGVVFAILGAWIAGVLYEPIMRFVRAFNMEINAPEWAREHMMRAPVSMARLQAQLLLPSLVAATYVKPLQDLFGLDTRQVDQIQIALLIACGFLYLYNTRILLARYLETVFVAWYTVKHGYQRTKAEKEAAFSVVRAKSQVVRYTMVKVCIQSFAVGGMYLACGFLNLGSLISFESQKRGNDQDAVASPVPEYVFQFSKNFVGFVATFTGLTWFLESSFLLWLFRTGTLVY